MEPPTKRSMKQYPEHLTPELLVLIEQVANDTATSEGIEQLESLLLKDEAARSLFLDYIDLHAALRRRFLQPTDQKPSDQSEGDLPISLTELIHGRTAAVKASERSASRLSANSGLKAAFALAACLLIAMTGYGLRGWFGANLLQEELARKQVAIAQGELPEEQRASLNGVAVLTKAVGVEWSDKNDCHAEGDPLPVGNVSIKSGLLQLEFYCGAVAVLEGPASFDLLAADKAYLRSGKFRARVPTQARGFTITTRSGDVVDLGTEFAIDMPQGELTGDDKAELHVIDGEVRFHAANDTEATPRHVTAGQAVRLNEQTLTEDLLLASAERFVGTADLETMARHGALTRYEEWKQYRAELLNDPDLVALYTYSPEPEYSRTMRNLAPEADEETHGAIVGCDWVDGRWPGLKGLEFHNASHRVCINVPGTFDSLTLSTWVLVDRFHPTNKVALLNPDTEQPRTIHWTLNRIPIGALSHFSETPQQLIQASRQHYGTTNVAVGDYDLHSWVHLAVVYDAEQRTVSHYRNGLAIGSQAIKQLNPLSIGVANLGNWPYKDWAKGTKFETRNLDGRMDEFVVMKRALQASEISDMHQAGKP